MTYFKQAWAFVRKWWWVALAAVVGVSAWILSRGGRDRADQEGGGSTSTVEATRDFVGERVERAEQDAKVESAKRDAAVENQKKQLDAIANDPDTRSRRNRLADFLSEEL